ncbi:MAG TPA: AMP-binding protein [Planctomycetaceae bacterium]|nr:AMP-binding protein [Planctomycetaceae bacterium]
MSPPGHFTREAISSRQLERLRVLLAEVIPRNPFWTRKLAAAGLVGADGSFDPAMLRALDDLRRLPFTTKAELVEDQSAHPPYGTNLTFDLAEYSRLHQTSGTTGVPLRWLDTPASWNWFLDCWALIYRLVGLRRDDRLAFPFSFGPFIGFWAAFDGAARLGNLCLPGGGMSSAARLRLIEEHRATVVCCTPTYALRLAEVAAEEGIDLAAGSVRALIVAGEPGGSIAATRTRIEHAWGARVFDHWGMTEIGSLAIECVENPAGLHVLETECIAEIIDPASGEAVHPAGPDGPGCEGELVITNRGRAGSPLIRYRTGDLVQADARPCPCGRPLLRLAGGILSRTDDMVTIRGNNVYPSRLEEILREFREVAEYRIQVTTVRAMSHLKIEIEPAESLPPAFAADALLKDIGRAIKDRLQFQAEVVAVPPGTLPRFELKGRRFVRQAPVA